MKKAYATLSALAVLALGFLVPVKAGAPPKPAGLPATHEAGFKAFSVKCARCHEPQRAYSRKYTEAKKIDALVSRMARKPGGAMSQKDRKAIAAYLLWHNKRGAR